MKTIFLFAGHHYYPSGGINDFVASFDTKEEAEKYVQNKKETNSWRKEWYDVVDITLDVYQNEEE